MERLAYLIKQRFPSVFRGVEALARAVTGTRFGRSRSRALAVARVDGSVGDQVALMRPLGEGDAASLADFLGRMPESHLRFFRPHGFDLSELERVLRSRAFMTYGLFIDDDLVAYALLKLSPTGSAFIGLMVVPGHTGRGLGRFLVGFLYWQASMAGLRARSTISRHNAASLKSHEAVSPYRVVGELPNDYLMIEFPPGSLEPPRLDV
ncbi:MULTISPECIES: GNAT family N-acetyltransferase [unclassified Ectothiorhodospira]|uniref:GNAT family N-acetyltransferase n=1 Tax=unclassified Ectothiorhodospira TaxID=2684909 RepID=UPI001EE86928|nr:MULTISPECIES: GNAT family N-acetyltransferase [unclassified Ectothiorhodospira]MCG5516396.1 GNAT family N-acetyltransferase [Ectothiorhodospira sp. 9100]MCG5519354.1 GNAT family N-acetyltransferase [Ectothiorhodospira sp. 9905]